MVDDHPIDTPDGMDDGVVPNTSPPFEFAGGAEQLMRAMEKAFVLQRKPAPPKKKRVVLPPPGKVVKVKLTKKVVAATTESPAVPPPPPRTPHPMGENRHSIASAGTKKDFDRNRDGATDAELERAAHLITNVTMVDAKTQKKYAEALQSFTNDLTHFLLLEVAPYESAIDNALVDAAEMVSLITGTQNVSFSLGRADTLLRRLPELKTLDWVCKRLAVPADIRELVINEYMGTNNDRKAKNSDSGGQSASQAQLSQLQQLLRMQRRAERAQPSVPGSSARTKR